MLEALAIKRFQKPGPVAGAFMVSTARVVGIMGPQGGGKTTAIINKILLMASKQPPSPVDGVARVRVIVWMRTYRELWAKVVPDWLEWLPQKNKKFGIVWTGGKDNPAEHEFRFQVLREGQKHTVELQVWFRAVGDQTPTEAAKGLHATIGWLPEATSATVEMRKALFGRLGRYPSAEHGGAPHRQLICDWNAGDPYNWTTEYFITERLKGVDEDGVPLVEFFRQPGGREATAENLHNLPATYYSDQVSANADDPDWIRRMVDNQIGFMRDGKPVYENFDEFDHVSEAEIAPWRHRPLIVAADGGLTPAAVIMQREEDGRVQVLEEIVTRRSGAEDFADLVLVRLDAPRYAGLPVVTEAFCDPATTNATESSEKGEDGELRSWRKIMTAKTKINWKPSRCGNDLVVRQASVNAMLVRRIGGRTAFRLDKKHCPTLYRGLARDYKFEKIQTVTQHGTEYKEKPNKSFASHVCNALEYAAANAGEQSYVTGKEERRKRLHQAAEQARRKARGRAQRPYDPLAGYGRRA